MSAELSVILRLNAEPCELATQASCVRYGQSFLADALEAGQNDMLQMKLDCLAQMAQVDMRVATHFQITLKEILTWAK